MLAALALTAWALLAHGYKFVNDDQILYIPFLHRLQNPTLYPDDYFFDQPQASLSLFEELWAWPVRALGLEWAMLVGYLLAQVASFLAVYVLATRLVSRRAAYLAMALFVMPVSIGGTFVRTYDNYFNPRTFTLCLGLAALVALRDKRLWLAALAVSVHLLLHPLSGIYPWALSVVLLAWWRWKREISWSALVGPLMLLAAVPSILFLTGNAGGELWLDPTWRDVLWKRTPYVFLSSWQCEDWIAVGQYLALGLVGWWTLKRREMRTDRLWWAVIGLVLASTLAVAIGVDGLALAPLAKLQLARSWGLVIMLATIFGAGLVLRLFERSGWGSLLIATLLAVTIYSNRADADWQPTFLLLLATLISAPCLERVWGSYWADKLMALGGVIIVLPSVLSIWPTASGWLLRLPIHWWLPKTALGSVLLVLGGLYAIRQVRSSALRTWRSRLQAGLGVALALVVAGSGVATERDLRSYVDSRVQAPWHDRWMSPSFRAWVDVQAWAAAHTRLDARFATDPDEKGFRVFALRAPIVEVKDGAPIMFSRHYALEWDRRMMAVAETGVVDDAAGGEKVSFSLDGLTMLHQTYPFDFVVARYPQEALHYSPLYSNTDYAIYVWPPPVQEDTSTR